MKMNKNDKQIKQNGPHQRSKNYLDEEVVPAGFAAGRKDAFAFQCRSRFHREFISEAVPLLLLFFFVFILTLNLGCSSVQRRKYVVAGPVVAEKVHSFEDSWEDQGPFKPDDPNLPLRRGKAGIVRFFKDGSSTKSVNIDGSLTVYVFEGTSEGVQLTKPIAKTVYTAEQLEKQRKYDKKTGYSYHVWLDLGEMDQPEEDISILSVFMDTKTKEQTTSKVIRTTIYGNPEKGQAASKRKKDKLFADDQWKKKIKAELAEKSGRNSEESINNAPESRTVTTIDLSGQEVRRFKNEVPAGNAFKTETDRRESLREYLKWQESQRDHQYDLEQKKKAELAKDTGSVFNKSKNALVMNNPAAGASLVSGNIGNRLPAASMRNNSAIIPPSIQTDNDQNAINQNIVNQSVISQPVLSQNGYLNQNGGGAQYSANGNADQNMNQNTMNSQNRYPVRQTSYSGVSDNGSSDGRTSEQGAIDNGNVNEPFYHGSSNGTLNKGSSYGKADYGNSVYKSGSLNQVSNGVQMLPMNQAITSSSNYPAAGANGRPMRYSINDVQQMLSQQREETGAQGLIRQSQAGSQSAQPLAPGKGFLQSPQQDRLNELFQKESDSSLQTEVLLSPVKR